MAGKDKAPGLKKERYLCARSRCAICNRMHISQKVAEKCAKILRRVIRPFNFN